MENAGLGVFSEIFIPKSTWLAEYEGEIRDWNSTFMKEGYAEYAWIVSKRHLHCTCTIVPHLNWPPVGLDPHCGWFASAVLADVRSSRC